MCSSPASAEKHGHCRGRLEAILLLRKSSCDCLYTELVRFSDHSIDYILPYLENGKSA